MLHSRLGAAEPHQQPMPAPWQEQLAGSFRQLLLIHLVRQECFVPAAQQYVGQHFGKGFTEPQPWTLDQVFEESSAGTPIIFILSTGVAARGVAALAPVQHFISLCIHASVLWLGCRGLGSVHWGQRPGV